MLSCRSWRRVIISPVTDSRENADGQPELPLFMCHADCDAAVKQATALDGDDGDPLEIVGLSPPSVVERLMSTDAVAFTFIPPSASTRFISDYLGTQDAGGV